MEKLPAKLLTAWAFASTLGSCKTHELRYKSNLTLILWWFGNQCVVFGTGGCLTLALSVWSWHRLEARLSICPLEKSPVLLEKFLLPVEDMAITIFDWIGENATSQSTFLEYDQTYAWNILTKHHPTNVLLIPSVQCLRHNTASFYCLLLYCLGYFTSNDIIRLWIVFTEPVLDEAH